MTTLREAAQQALEAWDGGDIEWFKRAYTVMEALRAALAEPRPIHECYGDCPTNPQTCPNPCNFEGRPRPVQEPVANRAFLERILTAMEGVIDVADRKTDEFDALRSCVIDLTMMLHTAPPQRTLTDEVIAELWHKNGGFHHHFARAIERWLKGNP